MIYVLVGLGVVVVAGVILVAGKNLLDIIKRLS